MPAAHAFLVAAIVAVLVIAHPDGSAAQRTPDADGNPRFEVVSIRPVGDDRKIQTNNGVNILPGGRLEANEAMLTHVVRFAYDLQPVQRIIGGEALLTKRFTIKAVSAGDTPVPRRAGVLGTQWDRSAFTEMARTMLAERFALRTHWQEEMVTLQVLTLATPGQTGPNLRRRSTTCVQPGALQNAASDAVRCGVRLNNGVVSGTVESLSNFADNLWLWTTSMKGNGVIFVDDTGLEGSFDVATRFNVLTLPGNAGVVNPTRQPYEDYPSFTDALRTDLGLRIESRRRQVRMLVIDHIEPPTEN